MVRPESLPINVTLVRKVERFIRTMNRSERKRIHRILMDEVKAADDKILSDNRNIVAARLPKDDYSSVINICESQGERVSAFLRRAIRRAIKENA